MFLYRFAIAAACVIAVSVCLYFAIDLLTPKISAPMGCPRVHASDPVQQKIATIIEAVDGPVEIEKFSGNRGPLERL